jgi:hypothetical protein
MHAQVRQPQDPQVDASAVPPVDPRLLRHDGLTPEDAAQLKSEVSRYIAAMSAELAGMARTAKLDILTYFLDMARLEAEVSAQRTFR